MIRIFVFIGVLLITVMNVYAADEPQPVLYFSFDDDTEKDIRDLSGNENTGVVVGNAKFIAGKYNKGISLGKPDYVKVVHSDTLVFGDEVTAVIWVNLEDTANQKVMGKTTTGNGFVIGVNGGIYPECWPQGAGDLTATKGSIAVGTWTHLALTYSANTENMVMYINGEEVGKLNNSGLSLGATVSNFLIGVAPWDPAQWQSAGIYDEVKLYNIALDADQVKNTMEEGIGGSKAVSPIDRIAATWGIIKNN